MLQILVHIYGWISKHENTNMWPPEHLLYYKKGKFKCLWIKIPILFSPPLSLSEDSSLKRKMKWLDHHCQPSMDGGWRMKGGDFGGEGEGAFTRL